MAQVQPDSAPSYTDAKGDNLHRAVKDNIEKIVKDFITDPKGGGNRKFFYERDPYAKGGEFDNHPMVWLDDYNVKDENKRLNGQIVDLKGNFVLVVETEDLDPQHKNWFVQISDDITHTFLSQKDVDLGKRGMVQLEIRSNNRITGSDREDKPILQREISFKFKMTIDLTQTT